MPNRLYPLTPALFCGTYISSSYGSEELPFFLKVIGRIPSINNKPLRDQARKSEKFTLPPAKKREILERQGNCCFWCHLPFGAQVKEPSKRKLHQLAAQFDHLIPFSYAKSSNLFVGACQLCNKLKGAALGTVKQLFDHVRAAWQAQYSL